VKGVRRWLGEVGNTTLWCVLLCGCLCGVFRAGLVGLGVLGGLGVRVSMIVIIY
jgi:hypothetical protein